MVVCTDYSGIGVGVDANGTRIQHEYLCSVSQAHDVFYSVQAAREAFPELSKSFVVVGHSQGGSTAWGCAQRQGIEPMEGYLGAVAVSPVTHMMSEAPSMAEIITAVCVPGIEAAFEKFDRRKVMTDEGMRRIDIICDLHANEPLITLLTDEISLLQDGWREDPSILEYQKRTETRGKKIEGPLLVVFGEADPLINIELCAKAVEDTAGKFPNTQIEFVRIPNVSHAASLTSSQQIWLKWTEDRFAGEPMANGLTQTVLTSARPCESYQPEMTWYIESKTAFYQV